MQKWSLWQTHVHTDSQVPFCPPTNASPSYTGGVYTWETTLVLKYCPLESLKNGREQGERVEKEQKEAAVSPVSFASSTAQNKAIYQRGHSLLGTRPKEYQFTALQSTLASVQLGFRFQTLNLKKVVAFSIKRLLYKCYGTAAFMFNNDSS